jgi:membrane-anchored mycosin MYCP
MKRHFRTLRGLAVVSTTGIAAVNVMITPPSASAVVLPRVEPGTSCPSDFKGFAPGIKSEDAWAQKRMELTRVWPITRGRGVTVAVIDSGVNFSHLLMGGVPRNKGIALGFASTEDCLGHGTEAASLIAAQPRTGYDFSGVAPEATILPVKEQQGDKDGDPRRIAAGITESVKRGARVINLSLNTAVDVPELRAAVDFAERSNVVLVCAANNEGDKADATTPYPAGYKTVLTVASTNKQDQHSTFSNTGDFISIAAPGEDVQVATPIANNDSSFYIVKGTSFAAPLVSGVAALVIAAHPNLTAKQVRERIIRTADAPPGTVPSKEFGYGIVNPYLAVTASLDDRAAADGSQTRNTLAPIPPVLAQDDGPRRRALGVGLALLGLTAVAGVAALVGKRGSRRGWRAA